MVSRFHVTAQGVVREADEADVSHLEWHGGPDLRSFYHATWHAHQSGECTLLVADLGGFPIGQIVILWRGKPSHPHFPDLQSLRVHPAFRGLGIGSELIGAAEKLVSKRGFERAGLSVGLDNPSARRLYEKLGYESHDVIYDEQWSYIDQNGHKVSVTERVVDLTKELAQD